MALSKPFNLFVYGTLMNPSVFRAVLGRKLVFRVAYSDGVEVFHARRAILHGYKKITPDNTYLYAVPDPHSRIRGYLIKSIPGQYMDALRQYEGKNYVRKRVRVQTASESEKAFVFISNLEQMQHPFGYQFRDNFKQEILLDRKIEAAILEVEREQLHTREKLTRRAVAELHGNKIRDLRRKHFEAGGISDYVIRRLLKDTPLPDFSRIIDDAEARVLSSNYLSMVIRQVVFNTIEEHVHRDFRYELDRMDLRHAHYDRTFSSLTALRMLNNSGEMMSRMIDECLNDLSFDQNHLLDFVRWAVAAADAVYDSKWAKREMDFIRIHMGSGDTPLGAELEFSNIGQAVISDPQGEVIRDMQYDGFLYFRDFGLDVLTWRLGGHLDDHYEKFSQRPRRGFFEVALGNVSVEANLSKPITDDPWLLSQFIHQAREFYEITPHSVHISLQIQGHRPARDRLLPVPVMKCLFAIAGDPIRLDDGRVVIQRLVSDEIIDMNPEPHMLFSEVSKRHSSDADPASYPFVRTPSKGGRYVQQFKFLRLNKSLNYEPLIMALKGLQINLSPGSFLIGSRFSKNRKHRRAFEELQQWGAKPEKLSADEIEMFLSAVYSGLMSERKGKPAHGEAYIAWSINQLRRSLKKFNELVESEEFINSGQSPIN